MLMILIIVMVVITVIMILFYSVLFLFIKVPSEQPIGQLHTEYLIKTQMKNWQ